MNASKDVAANFSVATNAPTTKPESVRAILDGCLSAAQIEAGISRDADYQFVYFSSLLTNKYRNESDTACQLHNLTEARESMKALTNKLTELQTALYGKN